ncbi:hypothetical protein [Desulforhopalus singaporensis]|uniref:Tetratricopeptide repeat-containing protein n=1 Tax=Desulforhopalus singaporensis TaxID=91360 RepID=A0A1H0UYK7_9BACT|nr:hypothetical protein [Desulforhopalus singaporensis]SDP71234.1 hypothetical protein SAMN05660330_03785 [Desulforhopalus singaporensis]
MNAGSLIIKAVLVLVLATAGVVQFRFGIREQLSFSDTAEHTGPSQLTSPHALTGAAKKKHLFEADLDGALALLKKALAANTTYMPAWLSLVELYNDMGRRKLCLLALSRVHALTEGLNRYRWEKTVVAYQIGQTELLPRELHDIIFEIPGKTRNDALRLAFTMWKTADDLLANVGEDNLIHLFNYGVRTSRPDLALSFWQDMVNGGVDYRDGELLALIDMLLRENRVADAGGIWHSRFFPEEALYNGDFTQPLLKKGFGWRLNTSHDYEYRVEPVPQNGVAGIVHLRFKGWKNINFAHLYQIVPLSRGQHYTFAVDMKSRSLSTNERPFWEITGYKCDGAKTAVTDMAAPNSDDYESYSVDFTVPDECAAVMVRLRRKPSNHLDNKISGQLWLKNPAISRSYKDVLTGEP